MITENNGATMNPEIIESWQKISRKDTKIVPVKGDHTTLFIEPIVKHTAKELETCMAIFENNLNETA